MDNKVRFCKKCRDNMEPHFFGYWPVNGKCPKCKIDIPEIDLSWDDFYAIKHVSENVNFYESMINLKQKDIIEYELKMSQFRTQVEQREQLQKQQAIQKQQESTQIRCPKCGSTQIQMVPRKWSLLTGFMTNKVDRVCANCKNRF